MGMIGQKGKTREMIPTIYSKQRILVAVAAKIVDEPFSSGPIVGYFSSSPSCWNNVTSSRRSGKYSLDMRSLEDLHDRSCCGREPTQPCLRSVLANPKFDPHVNRKLDGQFVGFSALEASWIIKKKGPGTYWRKMTGKTRITKNEKQRKQPGSQSGSCREAVHVDREGSSMTESL